MQALNDARAILAAEDDAPAMLWAARPDMACEAVSRGWLEFTGCSREQALGDGWSRGVHPEDLARWLDACVRAFDARTGFELEYRMRRRDGQYRWMLDRGRPRYSREGAFLGFVGACIDIDERKRAELEMARSLERERRLRVATEEAGRIKDELVACVLARLAEPLLRGVRVLVVEGDGDAREDMVKVLQAAGSPVKLLRESPIGPHVYPVVPLEYTNWRDEQRAWRETCILFNQSYHMTDMYVSGPDAFTLLEKLGINSFKGFEVNKEKVPPKGTAIKLILSKYRE